MGTITPVEIPDEVRDSLKVDMHTLQDALITQPELFLGWAYAAAEQQVLMEAGKANVDRIYAQLIISERTRAESSGTKVTVEHVKALVEVHPDYVSAQLQYLEAKSDFLVLAATRDAFVQRQSMIQMLAAMTRREQQNTP